MILVLRLVLGHILLLRHRLLCIGRLLPGNRLLLLLWLGKLGLIGRVNDDHLGLLRCRLVHRTRLGCHRWLYREHGRLLLSVLRCRIPLPGDRLGCRPGFLLGLWFNRFIITASRGRQ